MLNGFTAAAAERQSFLPEGPQWITISRPSEDHQIRLTPQELITGARQQEIEDFIPELYESAWPSLTSGVLVSGVERKLKEHRAALGSFDFPLLSVPGVFPRALEDSPENEKTAAEIAQGKVGRGFTVPLIQHFNSLSGTAKRDFDRETAHRAGADTMKHLIAISDDRGRVIDPRIAEILYNGMDDHWCGALQDMLKKEQRPAERVKEATSAQLGAVNEWFLRGMAMRELDAKGIAYDARTAMTTTLYIAPVIKGVLPVPGRGIIVQAESAPTLELPFTDKNIEIVRQRIAAGRIMTFDHFAMATKGVSLNKFKKNQPNHPYLTGQLDHDGPLHSPALAMQAAARLLDIPSKNADTQERKFYMASKRPQTVISSAALLTGGPDRDSVQKSLPLPKGMKLSKASLDGITSLPLLERFVYSGQAFVVQDPDRFDVPKLYKEDGSVVLNDAGEELSSVQNKNGDFVTVERIRLLRRLETALLHAYLTVMTTKPGAPAHFGRPHMVEDAKDYSFFRKYGLWHPASANMGMTGDSEGEAFRLYHGKDTLEQGLKAWDPETYTHDVRRPKNDFMANEAYFWRLMGKEKPKLPIAALYGSASSHLDEAYKDAEYLSHELAKMGVITLDGGGGRSSMRGFNVGRINALRDGFDCEGIGVRSESDVSPLEGSAEEMVASYGYRLNEGASDKHKKYADGALNLIKMRRLLPRQHAIAAPADYGLQVAGGAGSIVEALLTMTHNARVQIMGDGIFPGFESNVRMMPYGIVDPEIEFLGEETTLYSEFLKPWKDHLEFLGIHHFTGEDRLDQALEFAKAQNERVHARYKYPGQSNADKPSAPAVVQVPEQAASLG